MNQMDQETPAAGQGDLAVWTLAAATVDSAPVPSDVDVVFRQQPKPVEARHRVAYRTALLVLVLSRFNQGAARLTNLHTLMWATRSARTRRMFSSWWSGHRFYTTATERLDPDLQITLNLALVDEMVYPTSNGMRIRLTQKGFELARLIDGEEAVLSVEKKFLDGLDRLSDSSMQRKLAEVPR